jgi:hypothetical protein
MIESRTMRLLVRRIYGPEAKVTNISFEPMLARQVDLFITPFTQVRRVCSIRRLGDGPWRSLL